MSLPASLVMVYTAVVLTGRGVGTSLEPLSAAVKVGKEQLQQGTQVSGWEVL